MKAQVLFGLLAFGCVPALVEGIPYKMRKTDSVQVQKAKAKLNALRVEIETTETAMKDLEKTEQGLDLEREKSEKDFRVRFEKVLVPLLNWPTVALAAKVPSWIEREHLAAVLASLRAHLVKEPLELMAARQAKAKEADDLKQSQRAALKLMESRHGILLLQLEELLAMDKKNKVKKESLLKTPVGAAKTDSKKLNDKNKNKWGPAETEGLGPL